MMGVPINGPSFIYGKNKSTITNSSQPKSVLKKKCNAICYHACRESVAMDESRFVHISTHDNWANFLTKVTSGLVSMPFMTSTTTNSDKTSHGSMIPYLILRGLS